MDTNDNATDCTACVLLDCDNNIVVNQTGNHLVSMIGVSDMIVVHTQDATLICPKNEAQRVKELVGRVKEKFGGKFQ